MAQCNSLRHLPWHPPCQRPCQRLQLRRYHSSFVCLFVCLFVNNEFYKVVLAVVVGALDKSNGLAPIFRGTTDENEEGGSAGNLQQ